MKPKPLLRPDRLRHVPRQFSWIDQRFVRHRHITRCRPPALALYLLLVIVADEQGLSYYSDGTAAALLSISKNELKTARGELLQLGLIAYMAPYYQVLSLDYLEIGHRSVLDTVAPPPEAERTKQTLSMSEALRKMFETKGA
jgi:hypothetical protein